MYGVGTVGTKRWPSEVGLTLDVKCILWLKVKGMENYIKRIYCVTPDSSLVYNITLMFRWMLHTI